MEIPEPNGEIASHLVIHELANLATNLQLGFETYTQEVKRISAALRASLTYVQTLEVLQLNELLNEHGAALRRSLPYCNFDLRLAPVLLPVEGDKFLLKALFSELAVNASRAMRKSEKCIFRIETSKTSAGNAVAAVSDTGRGLNDEEIAKINAGEEFTTKTGFHSGKGFSFIRRILQKLGAEMKIESDPETGSTFTLYFPAC